MFHPQHVAYDENWKCAQRIWGAEVSSVIYAKPQKLKMNVSSCQADCLTAPFYGVRWSLQLGSNLYNFIKMFFLILLPSFLFLNGVTQSVTTLIIVYGCTCFFRKQSNSLFFGVKWVLFWLNMLLSLVILFSSDSEPCLMNQTMMRRRLIWQLGHIFKDLLESSYLSVQVHEDKYFLV